MNPASLRITEIFYSLQGETSRLGLPTVFVRLTGCPLRCGYCDSAYAFHGGKTMGFDEILAEVARHGARTVCVTGGEPLAQKHSLAFLTALCDAGYDVSLETSGALPIADVDPRVSRILDIKTPGSGELEKMHWDNLAALTPKDEVKFVLCDRADYEWARDLVRQRKVNDLAPVLFSPVWETLPPADLAAWVLEDHLPVRMQVQLHKILWGEKPGV
ncbi:7-carboxy-7-deazaguanine synthase QueE [Jeongeupia naejangsanensis]|uniref:7-carboxy-7-deazaguanine synthase n=1 Tax=Jeongeupia naejangsanensis TaxID=613195 RepID=A0ABS2BLR8_9NEIS|nr:7-carboxy-7-deazaguanine synthase QueE [Jeongeupia naejangsanensis]MBM3116559.1 7-carboxy-7-deazaguanine synthase QueE [Jeongeupia naejangsanensis]